MQRPALSGGLAAPKLVKELNKKSESEMSLIRYYRDLFQLGYVTKDLDRAIAFFEKKLGAGAFAVLEPELTGVFGNKTRTFVIRVALANIADRQIELIQPISGAVEFYRDGIDYDSSVVTLHHVGILVPGPEAAWTNMIAEVRAGGDAFTMIGSANTGTDSPMHFAYVDTRAYYGHFTEFLWRSPGAQAGNDLLPDYDR